MKCCLNEEEIEIGFTPVKNVIYEELSEKFQKEIHSSHALDDNKLSTITEKCIALGIAEKMIFPVCFNWKYLVTDKNYVISRSIAEHSEKTTHQIRVLKLSKRYRVFVPLQAQKELKEKNYTIKPLYKINERYLTKAQLEQLDYIEKRNAFAGYYVDISAKNLIKAAVDKVIPVNEGKTSNHLKKAVTLQFSNGKEKKFESINDCYEKYFAKICSKATFKRAMKRKDENGWFVISGKTYKLI